MSETSVSDSLSDESVSEVKKKKGKKRPSDFEIVRTILQRSHERKLPWLLKDMGEDSDIFFFCSQNETGFTYGSPELSVAIFEFTDPDLLTAVNTCLSKIHGLQKDHGHQRIINVRDQISELSKNKGISIGIVVEENDAGSIWSIKKDINGKERELPLSTVIDSLFHVQVVKSWCESYRPLLTTTNPDYLYYPYKHIKEGTGAVIDIPLVSDQDHPISNLYPHGFRAMVTRGIDVVLNKFLEEIPYPILSEEMIVFQDQSISCQIAHRIIAEGWRMILLRPNAIFFPTHKVAIPNRGNHSL